MPYLQTKRNTPKKIRHALLILLMVAFVTSGYFLVKYYFTSATEQTLNDNLIKLKNAALVSASLKPQETLQESVQPGSVTQETTPLDMLPQYRKVFDLNPDIVGWIKIPGTIVDYPVMQTPDNPQYYLNHNFNRQRSVSGSIFLDARCNVKQSHNLILYGHNMKSGTMFSVLSDYRKAEFFQAHRTIYLDTLWERRRYEVVACFMSEIPVQAKTKTIYDFIDIRGKAEYADFISLLKTQTSFDKGWAASTQDLFLTLSTCTGNADTNRLIVVAEKADK